MDYLLLTEQKISEKYERLSQDLKDVLSSINTSTTIENIAAKYRLNEEKTTMLIQLVGLVVLGFVNFENIKEEMKETIDINLPIIPLIADEIQQKIFLPIMNSLQKITTEKRLSAAAAVPAPIAPPMPPTIAAPAVPVAPAPMTAEPRPASPAMPAAPAPVPQPSADRYREPMTGAPEIIDLRKTPPPTMQMPVAVAPTPPAPKPAPPLTFTRQIEPPTVPLIEAEPHKTAPAPVVSRVEPPVASRVEPPPQYIMRPSGLPPTDTPRDVLDLRKDKGEF